MKNVARFLFLSIILLLPMQLSAQEEKSKKISIEAQNDTHTEETTDQSPLGRTHMQFNKRVNYIIANTNTPTAIQPAAAINSGQFQNRGLLNSAFLRNTIGVNSIFSHRVQRDFYFVGELGYFYANSILSPSNLSSFPQSGRLRNVSEVSLYPLYFGFRKGFYLNNTSINRYYPYIGAGIGTALGIGSNTSQNIFKSDFEITPSGYVTAGTEIYAFKKVFIDLGIRYRYLNFANTLGLWKDFSGFSFNIGFGYGFGMRLLR